MSKKWLNSLISIILLFVFIFGFQFLLDKKVDSPHLNDQGKKERHPDKSKIQQLIQKSTFLAKQYDYINAIRILKYSSFSHEVSVKKQIQALNTKKEQLKNWSHNLQIPHLFVHSLIQEPSKAFARSNPQRDGYQNYMITVSEFKKMLPILYKKGYVLVSIHDISKIENGKMKLKPKPILLPKDKKLLVLSQDDVSYYEYMENSGFTSSLISNEEGKITNEYQENGKTIHGSYDMVPLLNAFVQKHPDFFLQRSKRDCCFNWI